MATTAVPYLLEDLMLVQAFMVSLHVPQLQGGESVKTVLRELVPMSQVKIIVCVSSIVMACARAHTHTCGHQETAYREQGCFWCDSRDEYCNVCAVVPLAVDVDAL